MSHPVAQSTLIFHDSNEQLTNPDRASQTQTASQTKQEIPAHRCQHCRIFRDCDGTTLITESKSGGGKDEMREG